MTSDTLDVSPPDAPPIANFAFPDFYRAMVERERLQVARDEAKWSEKHGNPSEPVDVLLNFGCNVRQTPHLMRDAVAVFETLGIRFAAVAGQQYCCGKPYSNNGLKDVARHVVEASVRRMASYRPNVEIQWCSACEMQFHDVVVPEVGIAYESKGMAAFLLQRLDELGDRVPWRTDVRIRALVHGHLGEHVVRDGHPPIVMQLLQRIPGVELVGLAQTPALDICDNAGIKLAAIDSREYREIQSQLEGYVREADATTIVTLYHSCTRELTKFASERMGVRHYISLIADALGVANPDRFQQYWRLGDPVQVMEASRPNWESWGIDEADALRLAHKYFVPSYAANAPDCPCNGECTATGAAWLSATRVQKDVESGRLKELDLA